MNDVTHLCQIVGGHAFASLMPLALGQCQANDGIGEQMGRGRYLLDQQPLGAVYGQYALRILMRILDAGVPMIEGQTDEQIDVTLQHLVAAHKAAHLQKEKRVEIYV